MSIGGVGRLEVVCQEFLGSSVRVIIRELELALVMNHDEVMRDFLIRSSE